MSIRQKLLLSPLAAAVGFVVIGSVAAWSTSTSVERLALLGSKGLTPVASLQVAQSSIDEMRYRMVGYLAGQAPAKQSAEQASKAVDTLVAEWAKSRTLILGRDPALDEMIQKLDAATPKLQSFVGKLVAAYKANDRDEIQSLIEDEWPWLNANLVKPLSSISRILAEKSNDTVAEAEKEAKTMMSLSILAGVLSMAGVLLVSLVVSRRLNKDVQQLAETASQVAAGQLNVRVTPLKDVELNQIASAITKMTEAFRAMVAESQQVNGSLVNLSRSLENEATSMAGRSATVTDNMHAGSSAIEQMAHSAREISDHAEDASGKAKQMLDTVLAGESTMLSTVMAAQEVFTAINEATNSVSSLTSRIDAIGDVANIIKEIADQTNLLALNAAIEAARAGEQGRGFAVVADEVRKLAEKTAVSTSQISDGVHAIHNASQQTAQIMANTQSRTMGMQHDIQQLDAALASIKMSSEALLQAARSIADATAEQRSAAETTAGSMATVSAMNDESFSLVTRINQATHQMGLSLAQMERVISRFHV